MHMPLLPKGQDGALKETRAAFCCTRADFAVLVSVLLCTAAVGGDELCTVELQYITFAWHQDNQDTWPSVSECSTRL
jgi:hypothetical protein